MERYLYYPEMQPRKTVSADFLKFMAVVLVAASLTGIYFAATSAPAPLFRIRDIQGNFMLNYAVVMVEGVVAEPVKLDTYPGGRIRLTLTLVEPGDSQRTTLTVFVYDPVASRLLTSDKYVDFGDYVRLLIQVRVREEFTYGILQDVEHLMIVQRVVVSEPLNVSSLQGVEEFTYVCATGTVLNPRNVSAGLLFNLVTGKDSITVLVPQTFSYRYSGHYAFNNVWNSLNVPGGLLRVCGPVYYYRGTSPEIVVLRLDDITPVLVEETGILELETRVGETASVLGIFSGLSYDRSLGLYVITLRDEEGNEARALAPRSLVVNGIDPWSVGIGSRLRVTGSVLDPTVINATQIEVVEYVHPPNVTRVGDALVHQLGHIVILWNVSVVSSTTTSGGSWIIDVADDTGTIRIFVPSSVARRIGTLPRVNSLISVAGYRDVYNDIEEIVVYSENGLVVLGEAVAVLPSPVLFTPVNITSLANYVGRNVSVLGELVSISYSSAERLYYVTIKDTTGIANFTMTRDLVKLINPWNAGPGTVLRLNGTARSQVLVETRYLEVLDPKPTPILNVREAQRRPHGSLVAVVNATVSSIRVTSGNDWQINITDATGAVILVFVPRSVVAEINRTPPTVGQLVNVAGYRDIFAGIEEIVVYTAEGLRW